MLSVLTFRTPKEAVEKANNTPYGLSAGVWTDKGSRILWMAEPAARRRRLGQHVQPVRPVVAVRRLQGVGLRPRGRPARAGGVPRMSRIAVRKTYKLYVGGKFPRSESGRSYEVTDASGHFVGNVAKASRKDARDAVVAARAAFPGWSAATAYNRGQVLYRVAEVMEGRREQFVDEVAAAEGLQRRQAAPARRRGHRPLGLVRRLDRQARPGRRRRQPGRRAVLRLLGAGADRRRRRRRAAGLLAARPRVGRSRRSSRPATPRWCWRAQDRPVPAVTLSEVLATSDVPGGVVNVLTGDPAEVAPWLASHMDVNAIDLTGCTRRRAGGRPGAGRRRQPQAGAAAGPAPPDWTADPGLSPAHRVPRDQDRLAPDRPVARP